MSLKTTAQKLVKTADELAKLCEQYLADAAAEARETGRNDTAGGMSPRQLKQRLQNEIVARLCPKSSFRLVPGMNRPVRVEPALEFPNAVEARKFIAARGPLPGLPS